MKCVSLLLKDLTDSDPEPSTIERLGAGPASGFKWESSVGELSPPPFPPSLPCLAVLLPYLFNLWLQSPTTADLSLLTCLVLTFGSWNCLLGVCCWDGQQLCMWRLKQEVWFRWPSFLLSMNISTRPVLMTTEYNALKPVWPPGVCVCKTTHIKVESWTVRLCQWKHFHKHWVSCNSFEFQQLQKK